MSVARDRRHASSSSAFHDLPTSVAKMSSMDVDTQDIIPEDLTPAQSQNEPMVATMKAEGKKPMAVPVDDAHPFDLEAYNASYSGAHLTT